MKKEIKKEVKTEFPNVETIDLTNDDVIKTFYDAKKGIKSISNIKREFPTKKHKEVEEKIKALEAYQLTRRPPTRRNYIPIYSLEDNSYQVDLMFMEELRKQNHNYGIIFTAIEITSRYAYAIPLKKKDEKTMAECMKLFIKESGCKRITSDAGAEFVNKTVKQVYKDNDVKYTTYKSNDAEKRGLSLIERFNRTLRNYIIKYIQINDSLNWIDSLQDLVYNYNHTYNSSVKGVPYKIINDDKKKFLIRNEKVKKAFESIKDDDIYVGDFVRILTKRDIFTKEGIYYTDGVYKVIGKKAYSYILDDEEGNKVPRTYRAFQLQRIERIIKPTKRNTNIINEEYKQAKKEHKIERKLKQEDLLPSIEGKRERKNKKIFDPSDEINKRYV